MEDDPINPPVQDSLHSKQKYAYNTHNTTNIELYIGNITLPI